MCCTWSLTSPGLWNPRNCRWGADARLGLSRSPERARDSALPGTLLGPQGSSGDVPGGAGGLALVSLKALAAGEKYGGTSCCAADGVVTSSACRPSLGVAGCKWESTSSTAVS